MNYRLGIGLGSSSLAVLLLGCPSEETPMSTSDGTTGGGDPDTTAGDSITTVAEGSDTGGPPPVTTTDPDPTTSGADASTGEPTVCGDGVAEGDENCDGEDLVGADCLQQGFQGGELACDADCDNFDTTNCFFYICGNDTIQGDEVCDGTNTGVETCVSQGFESGTLGCAVNCLAFDTSTCGSCGDGMLNGDEVCEGADLGVSDCEMEGFDGGNLACAADCTYDTSDCSMCGDGFANGFEPCDGADLGGETCASLGLDGGTLACTAGCTYDFSMCDIAGIPFGSDSGYNGFSLSPVILPCDEISATGTATGLFDDDAVSVPIGFTFPFYGVNYTDVSIQSNGALRFGDNTVIDYDNACPVPTAQAPSSNSLWVFWDDLDPSEFNAAVYYQTLGPAGAQRMVVQWDVPFFFGDLADFLRFQAVLHQSGNIDVCFVDMTNGAAPGNFGAEATIGIQQNSTDGFSFSCNAPNATNGTMLLYLPI